MSKKVVINGQTVTLYSINGQTWLSSPDQIPEVMARLDNTRVLLNDPKGEGATLPPKPTAARYRLRGPKQRPILQQDGVTIEGPPGPPLSAAATEIRVGVDAIELVTKSERPPGEHPIMAPIRPIERKAEDTMKKEPAPKALKVKTVEAPQPVKGKQERAPAAKAKPAPEKKSPKAMSAPKSKAAAKPAPAKKKAAAKPAPKKKAK